MESAGCCPIGWQYQQSEPLMLALGPQCRGRNSQATKTHPTTLSCPPTSVKNVKFHLLPSTSTSGLQCPIATLSLEVLSWPLQLPAPNPPPPQSCLQEENGRTVARNLCMTSENGLQLSPVIPRWSQGCSEAQNEVANMKTHSWNSTGGRESF